MFLNFPISLTVCRDYYEPEVDEEEYPNPEIEDHMEVDDDRLNVSGVNGHEVNGQQIIPSGDAAAASKNKAPKDKKIAKEDRKTTPYMTKYERARILGTRALQIRFVYRI